MKKNSLIIMLMVAALLLPRVAFATETDVKGSKDKTPVVVDDPGNLPVEESAEDDEDASEKYDFAEGEAPAAPIATVSDGEKSESAPASVKTEKVPAKVHELKASAKSPAKKTSEKKTKKEASSMPSSAELNRRWKALFSKEIDPDSVAYTVKSGDSLYVLAQKYHTTVDLIKKINGLKSDNIYPKMKLKIHTAPFSIEIDKSKNVLVLYSKDEAVKKYSVATGKKNCTPVGEFKITDKLVNPTWFKTGAILPPGSPENALGTRWMGFDKPSYGIHGTIEPKSIGSQASEGCIRMLNEEVEELYSLVPVGTKVTIQD
jgi:lipoprotein-anchoring transpeptidase ErfK/SrfK